MKQNVLILIIILCSTGVFATEPMDFSSNNNDLSLSDYLYNDYNNLSTDSDYDLALMNLQVDVMGLLFFGPEITLDFQFANMVAVGPYIRWNYAGVIYQGVITDWFSEETVVSPASYGIGVQAKILIPVGSGMHRPYAGFSYERFKGKESYDPGGYDGEHIWEYKANVMLLRIGYRMITESSFNLSIGLMLGASVETENIDYYEFGDGVDHNPTYTRFIGALQLGLGWQLGK